ncbi:uncharacterized protein [Dysidea avara]|uniref:uncharacterized protein n=1 Tax=Dysidea avara TaxID=196820 RepID=UPI00332CBC80
MVAIIATYYLAFIVHSLVGNPRFLAIQDTNGERSFKTGCLATDQHCTAKLEIHVVGMDSTVLSMTTRDVIISHNDKDSNTTYYLRTDPFQESALTETHDLENATMFQMATSPIALSSVKLVRFTDTATNKTLQAVLPEQDDNCVVGDLEMVEEKTDASLFRVYDHFAQNHFAIDPECCV